MAEETQSVVERVARESYGRLVAYLAADTSDVADAEDLLSEALVKAIEMWPERGVPDNPEAWLLRVGRRRRIDAFRRTKVHERYQEAQVESFDTGETMTPLEDRRLALMCACADPALDRAMHTPLILNVILGLAAKDISSAFLVKPATMSQRLTRAKAQIKETGLRLDIPDCEEFADRVDSIAEAIYGAYGIGWELIPGTDSARTSLADEALWLSEFLVRSLPEEPEALGLHALLLYLDSRKEARGAGGVFIPIGDQEVEKWNRKAMDRADHLLRLAGEKGKPGKFQWEACIQAAHSERAKTGKVDWAAIISFYQALYREAPSIGKAVALAGAQFHAGEIESASNLMMSLKASEIFDYQPYWVLRTWLDRELEDDRVARASSERAIGLTESPQVREWLIRQWTD